MSEVPLYHTHTCGVGESGFFLAGLMVTPTCGAVRKVNIRLPEKRNSHAWREAGPPNHHNDKVDSDQ